MNTLFKIFLSMSFSGGLLILILLLGKQFWQDKLSRQWQYYIWLVVILRLLLPFGPEASLMGKTYQTVDQAVTQAVSLPASKKPLSAPEDAPASSADSGQNLGQDIKQSSEQYAREGAGQNSKQYAEQGAVRNTENTDSPMESLTAARPLRDIASSLTAHIWLVWLIAALGLLIWKVTIYRSFIRYIRTGMTPVSDIGILDRLSAAAAQADVKRPIELCVNPFISSPLLMGFFHPCIVLPDADIPEKDFQYTVLHELTHYRRQDMFYKWLVQITVCLHWFNPLVHLMGREIARACEFSCDEAVLAKTGCENAQDYGKTLLDAMAAVGKYRETYGALTLSENKKLLKERLSAIMKLKERSKTTKMLTAALTLCAVLGTAFIGVYSVSSANDSYLSELSQAVNDLPSMETLEFQGSTYYLVQDEAQLRAIATGAYGMDQNYMQQADIALSAEEWVPIGTKENPFTGSFNGNGFEISGLTMTDPDAKLVGLFGMAENAHIYNITLRDLDIESAGRNTSQKSVGAIAAITRGKGGRGSRVYDNFVYPKETDGETDQNETAWKASGNEVNRKVSERDEDDTSQVQRYYASGSLPLFEIAFSKLDENAQKTWLEKIYADDEISFFSVAMRELAPGSSLPTDYAEKAYADEEIAFFSVLTEYLDESELESWLERALTDENWAFQSVLYDALGRSDEFDELEEKQEKEWEKERIAKYEAVGVTMNGKNYFYQGQPVHIFLDIVRPDRSFYTLQMNPSGTVNIKILRNEENEITGVAYMSEAEVTELFGEIDP